MVRLQRVSGSRSHCESIRYRIFNGAVVVFTVIVLVLTVTISSLWKDDNDDLRGGMEVVKSKNATKEYETNNNIDATIKYQIFCYGDSLTAGMTMAANREFHPYAPHLERTLRDRYATMAHVDHVGLPGWTTLQMMDSLQSPTNGLVGNLRMLPKPDADLGNNTAVVNMVVLLAGTNDLGRRYDPSDIVSRLIQLNQEALTAGAETSIVLGIPPSRWQSRNLPASSACKTVNTDIATHFSRRGEERTTFVAFPFPYNESDPKWSRDGLHLSPHGYQALGESLAPIVEKLLRHQG